MPPQVRVEDVVCCPGPPLNLRWIGEQSCSVSECTQANTDKKKKKKTMFQNVI